MWSLFSRSGRMNVTERKDDAVFKFSKIERCPKMGDGLLSTIKSEDRILPSSVLAGKFN